VEIGHSLSVAIADHLAEVELPSLDGPNEPNPHRCDERHAVVKNHLLVGSWNIVRLKLTTAEVDT
jgi:hypothetical protein